MYCELSHNDWYDCMVAMKQHGDDNEEKQPGVFYPNFNTLAHMKRLGGIALRTGTFATELPSWTSHSEPVGCEPHDTTAVCVPVRTGLVFV